MRNALIGWRLTLIPIDYHISAGRKKLMSHLDFNREFLRGMIAEARLARSRYDGLISRRAGPPRRFSFSIPPYVMATLPPANRIAFLGIRATDFVEF